MFSALKFVAAGVIVALFGGFLLAGVLTTPQGDEMVPAAVTESPQPEESDTAFPTGSFVSEQDTYRLIEFDEDGTGSYRDAVGGWDMALTYAVDGDLYTELTVEAVRAESDATITYRWDYDGERLAFVELVSGEEAFVYSDNTYRPIEDPRIVVVAAIDIEAGEPILDWKMQRGFVPTAELGPKLYFDPDEFVGGVPLAPVAKGQPITADLIVPAE